MKELFINDLQELTCLFKKYSDSHLFRGQTQHFPRITTSRFRSGCCSKETIKWSTLALDIIRSFVHNTEIFDKQNNNLYNYGEAILQHYGYTSYFLDTTYKPEVACWFASHESNVSESFEITEDCNEQGILTKRRKIKYNVSQLREGHIYLIDKKKINSDSIFDLVNFIGNDSICRFVSQGAVMITNILSLPEDTIEAHIIVPIKILCLYYEENNILSTEQLFPSYHDDIIYRQLKSVHWRNINETGLPVFQQALSVPEYESCGKIQDNQIAFYTPFSICEKYPEIGNKISYTILVDSFYFYVNISDDRVSFPCVIDLARRYNSILFESNDLIDYPEFDAIIFMKGIIVSIHDNLLYIEPIDLSYKGQVITQIQITKPWVYSMIGTKLIKIQHHDSCPCNNAFRHQRDYYTLCAIEDLLEQHFCFMFAAKTGKKLFLS